MRHPLYLFLVFCSLILGAQRILFGEPLTANKLTPTQTVLSFTPAGQAVYSQPVRFVAKVVPTYVPGHLPSGDVQFFIDKQLVATQPIVNNVAAFSTSALQASLHIPHQIKAVYLGDQTYASSSDLADYYIVPAYTQTQLTSSINPSSWGEAIDFTAMIQAMSPASSTPQGSVQFQLEGQELQLVALDNQGHASYTTAASEVGAQEIKVTYLGSDNFQRSSTTLLQRVEKSATKLSLESAQNPTPFGENVKFMATVTSPLKERIPSGSVQFQINGVNAGSPIILDKAVAKIDLPDLSAGIYQVAALYFGDDHFRESANYLAQQVVPAVTETSLKLADNPIPYKSHVEVHADVTAKQTVPSGVVNFSVDKVVVAKKNLDASGVAKTVISNLGAGPHHISATFIESENYKGSTSQAMLQVNKGVTNAVLKTSQNPATEGDKVTLTVQVSSNQGKPRGNVEYSIDGQVEEKMKLDDRGSAVFKVSNLKAGEHEITVHYVGNDDFSESSTALQQTIRAKAPSEGEG